VLEMFGDLGIVDQLLQRIRGSFALQQCALVNRATCGNQGIDGMHWPLSYGSHAGLEAAAKEGPNRGITLQGQLRLGQVEVIPVGKEPHRRLRERRWQGIMHHTAHP
jgi:hypothetical protein